MQNPEPCIGREKQNCLFSSGQNQKKFRPEGTKRNWKMFFPSHVLVPTRKKLQIQTCSGGQELTVADKGNTNIYLDTQIYVKTLQNTLPLQIIQIY